jgi:hypothetical protein
MQWRFGLLAELTSLWLKKLQTEQVTADAENAFCHYIHIPSTSA